MAAPSPSPTPAAPARRQPRRRRPRRRGSLDRRACRRARRGCRPSPRRRGSSSATACSPCAELPGGRNVWGTLRGTCREGLSVARIAAGTSEDGRLPEGPCHCHFKINTTLRPKGRAAAALRRRADFFPLWPARRHSPPLSEPHDLTSVVKAVGAGKRITCPPRRATGCTPRGVWPCRVCSGSQQPPVVAPY